MNESTLNREAWLQAAVQKLRPMFQETKLKLGDTFAMGRIVDNFTGYHNLPKA